MKDWVVPVVFVCVISCCCLYLVFMIFAPLGTFAYGVLAAINFTNAILALGGYFLMGAATVLIFRLGGIRPYYYQDDKKVIHTTDAIVLWLGWFLALFLALIVLVGFLTARFCRMIVGPAPGHRSKGSTKD